MISNFLLSISIPVWQYTVFTCLCEVFVSLLIRFVRECSNYLEFKLRYLSLISKLLKQEYSVNKLQATFKKCYGHHNDFITKYDICESGMSHELFMRGYNSNNNVYLYSSKLE